MINRNSSFVGIVFKQSSAVNVSTCMERVGGGGGARQQFLPRKSGASEKAWDHWTGGWKLVWFLQTPRKRSKDDDFIRHRPLGTSFGLMVTTSVPNNNKLDLDHQYLLKLLTSSALKHPNWPGLQVWQSRIDSNQRQALSWRYCSVCFCEIPIRVVMWALFGTFILCWCQTHV